MLGAARAVGLLVCLFGLTAILNGQPRVDPRNTYERILAVVPVIGTGTPEDPIRPMFIPSPREMDAAAALTPNRPPQILGYAFVLSDDGKFALTEIVMRDRSGFQAIAATAGVKAFIKGASKVDDVVATFRQFKKDFAVSQLGVKVR